MQGGVLFRVQPFATEAEQTTLLAQHCIDSHGSALNRGGHGRVKEGPSSARDINKFKPHDQRLRPSGFAQKKPGAAAAGTVATAIA